MPQRRLLSLLILLFFASASPLWAQNVVYSWHDNSNNEEGFNIYSSVPCAPPGTGCSFIKSGTVGMDIVNFTHPNQPVGSNYCGYVTAYNSVGESGPSNVECIVVIKPPPPDEKNVLSLVQTVPADPTSPLRYLLKEGSGQLAYDTSDHNRTGFIKGAWANETINSLPAKAVVLDGATDMISTPLSNHSPVRTYLFWSKRTGPGGALKGRLFDKRQGGPEVEVFYNDENVASYKYIRVWSDVAGTWTVPQPSLNVWHHIAIVYDQSSPTNQPKIFIDGNPVTVTTMIAPVGSPVNSSDTYIIGNRGDILRGWNGSISKFLIYDRALTQAEIQALM